MSLESDIHILEQTNPKDLTEIAGIILDANTPDIGELLSYYETLVSANRDLPTPELRTEIDSVADIIGQNFGISKEELREGVKTYEEIMLENPPRVD